MRANVAEDYRLDRLFLLDHSATLPYQADQRLSDRWSENGERTSVRVDPSWTQSEYRPADCAADSGAAPVMCASLLARGICPGEKRIFHKKFVFPRFPRNVGGHLSACTSVAY